MVSIVFLVVFLMTGLSETAPTELGVLAPEIICPDGGNNTLGRPDFTMIKILSESQTRMNISWAVGWSRIANATQRLTIMAWKSVRDLEKSLNGPQTEPLLSIIKNDELISGVNYILNLTANASDEIINKSFSIKYNKNNQDTTVTTINDDFSMVLLGGRSTYPYLEFIIEAVVTTCSTAQDYYFVWEVSSATSDHFVNNTGRLGSRLELPRYALRPGTYKVNCQLRNDSDDVLIKEVNVPIQVFNRGLNVFLSVERLIVSTDNAFNIEAMVVNYDYEDYPVEYEWKCFTNVGSCDLVENNNGSSLNFSSGIPNAGEYLITLSVAASNSIEIANASIIVVASNLPVVQTECISRIINQGSSITVVGKASQVAPSCSVTWYFDAEGFVYSTTLHGEAMSETHVVFSLEENFLNELVDFSNYTASVEVVAKVTSGGRARFVAECNCTASFDCENIDVTTAYAEVHFQLNESPKVEELVVSPKSGSALDTLFQIRCRAKDADKPLRYSFYCSIGPNVTLLLGSYIEYETVETFLPFIDGDTSVWVEVCDALDACSKSKTSVIQVLPSSGNTFELLIDYVRAFVRRCEVIRLMHVTMSSIVSYTNAGQSDRADLFSKTLLESLPDLRSGCSLPQYQYILEQLTAAGFDVTRLLA